MSTSLRTSAAVVAIALTSAAIANADGYEVYIIALVGITTLVGIGLNVLLGLSGQISLGHVGFYAIGAYTTGILTTTAGWSFWLALPLAAAVAGIAGTLLALPALRVRGPYLAMITIAFGFVVEQGAAEWRDLTGGWSGLMGIPPPQAFGVEFQESDIAYLVLALTVLGLWLYARLGASPWGRALRALRDSDVAGASLGFNPMLLRTFAFAVSAAIAGIAGGLFASMSSFISPESFPFFQSILFLLVVMIGGADRLLGPLLGAALVVLLPEFLSSLAEHRLLFVGLLLLIVLRLAPEGIVGALSRLRPGVERLETAAASETVAPFLNVRGSGSGLEVERLCITFGGVQAVKDFGFEARPGEITSIIGPNGAGKTTALNLIGGYYRPDAGGIRIGGKDVAGRSSHAVARAGVARTYQTTQLFERMSVLDNVIVGLGRGRLRWSQVISRGNDAQTLALAQGLLAFVGYTGPIHRQAGALPHVDKRLVEIARALATRPGVLLLDEPAAGLGHDDTARLGELLTHIAGHGLAVVLVEHDMRLVMGISHRVVVMDAGSKIAEDVPASVQRDPAVLEAYLGAGAAVERSRGKAMVNAPPPILDVRGLSAGYGAAPVLHGLDLEVGAGELVCVLGANGAGKSTLMRALCGLHRPVTGEVSLEGARIETGSAHRIAARGLVLVPEGRQVFPDLSVTDNIGLGAYARPRPDLAAAVEAQLERFPRLKERRTQKAGLLSGGEQQMLAIARGLIAQPTLLMLDEPSLGLAPGLIEDLYSILAGLRDEGVTILLVDQMAELALSVSDRAYVLDAGRFSHSGTAAQMAGNAALRHAYLGAQAGGP